MRFMIIRRADELTEAEVDPEPELFRAMMSYNEEMANAGVLLDGMGLHPTKRGTRISFVDGTPTITDGPFPETKELIAGFTLIETRDLDEALEWVRRWPEPNVELELRRVYEIEDFGDAVPQDVVEQEARIRENTGAFGDR